MDNFTLNLRRGRKLPAIILLALFLYPLAAHSQAEKVINSHTQAWTSLNTAIRLKGHWGMMADFHVRRTEQFIQNPNFYLLRLGGSYYITDRLVATAGYSHMWLASAVDNGWVYGNEERIYQELLFKNQEGRVKMIQRVRNEQRWQQKLVGGQPVNDYRFTNRFRYLINLFIPISRNPVVPQLMLSDEILLNYGRQVGANSFDQNRITIGVKEKLSKTWSMDLGYMYVFQERPGGIIYDQNHTLRVFFFYQADWRKKKNSKPGL